MAKVFVTQTFGKQCRTFFSEEGFWGKLKQLGAEIGQLVGQLTGTEQPEMEPIPVRVEK